MFGVHRELGGLPHSQSAALEARAKCLYLRSTPDGLLAPLAAKRRVNGAASSPCQGGSLCWARGRSQP